MKCIRCDIKMENLGTYKFESQKDKRGLMATLMDIEEHLKFEVQSCPKCGSSELFYKGKQRRCD